MLFLVEVFFAERLADAWASALPAADFDVLLVRPSRRVADAFFATFFDVVRLGALRCDSALPADDFDFVDVLRSRSVLDALPAAFLPVTFAMSAPGWE